jgi:chromosome segregation ATPase
MATALYLETFLENIESLPRDFQRNFALIKDLDNRVQGLEEEIKSLLSSYEKEVKKLSEADRKANLCQIQEKFDKMKEYSDDKVQLAVQMYEMVDKHIRRLDGDLARFEAEIHMKENEKRKESISTDLEVEEHNPSNDLFAKTGRRKSSRGQLPKPSGITTPPPLGTFTDPAHDVLDMPVDPNEPTYCLCHQVSLARKVLRV